MCDHHTDDHLKILEAPDKPMSILSNYDRVAQGDGGPERVWGHWFLDFLGSSKMTQVVQNMEELLSSNPGRKGLIAPLLVSSPFQTGSFPTAVFHQ